MLRFGVVRAFWMRAGVAFGGFGVTACVVGAERPPTRLELARVPSEAGSREAAGLSARRGCAPAPADTASPRPSPLLAGAASPHPSSAPAGAVWIAGYCHSTSVRYEWVPGHWERHPSPGLLRP